MLVDNTIGLTGLTFKMMASPKAESPIYQHFHLEILVSKVTSFQNNKFSYRNTFWRHLTNYILFIFTLIHLFKIS